MFNEAIGPVAPLGPDQWQLSDCLAGKSAQRRPGRLVSPLYLAAAYALSGCPELAHAELGVAKGLPGAAFEGSVARLGGHFAPAPQIRARFEVVYRAGLSARVPEE
jgi:hypothetical protein